jgi:hypothetical protein
MEEGLESQAASLTEGFSRVSQELAAKPADQRTPVENAMLELAQVALTADPTHEQFRGEYRAILTKLGDLRNSIVEGDTVQALGPATAKSGQTEKSGQLLAMDRTTEPVVDILLTDFGVDSANGFDQTEEDAMKPLLERVSGRMTPLSENPALNGIDLRTKVAGFMLRVSQDPKNPTIGAYAVEAIYRDPIKASPPETNKAA